MGPPGLVLSPGIVPGSGEDAIRRMKMMRRCSECKKDISDLLDACPYCGKDVRAAGKKAWSVMMWIGFALLAVYLFLSF